MNDINRLTARVRTYYLSQRLPADRIEAMMAIHARRRPSRPILAAAAALTIAVGLSAAYRSAFVETEDLVVPQALPAVTAGSPEADPAGSTVEVGLALKEPGIQAAPDVTSPSPAADDSLAVPSTPPEPPVAQSAAPRGRTDSGRPRDRGRPAPRGIEAPAARPGMFMP